jgi:hypothetical protein
MALRFKPEVRIVELTDALATVLRAAATWSTRNRIEVEINSIDDAAPGRVPETLHGLSLAIDLDTVGDKSTDLELLTEYLARHLPEGFDLVFEGNHLHVERDTHRPRPVRHGR